MASHRVSAAENEYLAEEMMITIVPNINHPVFHFVSGTFGPFDSGIPCEVPLWLAITLRKRSKCIIQMPDWMTVENLELIVNHERTQQQLGQLPYHYAEVAQLLLTNAQEDITQPEKVTQLLQDLELVRMDRIRIGIANIAGMIRQDQSVVSTSLNYVSAMEILSMKDFFLGSLDAFLWLRPPEDAADGNTGTATTSANNRLSSGQANATTTYDRDYGNENHNTNGGGNALGGVRKLRKLST